MDPAQPDPYVTPPQYRDSGPSLDGASPVRLLSYPPLQQAERRRSAGNTDMGSRRAFAANLQMVEPYSNEVHRPTYTQRLAPPPVVTPAYAGAHPKATWEELKSLIAGCSVSLQAGCSAEVSQC